MVRTKQVDARSSDDKRANKISEASTIHDGDRYAVGLLWAEDHSQLPNNYYSALAQLKSLEKRLDKDTNLRALYAKNIQEDFDKSQKSPFAVRLPIVWVLSGPLPASTGLISTCLHCNIEDVSLVEQVKSWYELESYGTYKLSRCPIVRR